MDNQNIGAIHHSEKRYSSLTLIAYSTQQRAEIQEVLNKQISSKNENITISESEVDDILETTVEYHNDNDKKSGDIFKRILSSLNIEEYQ